MGVLAKDVLPDYFERTPASYFESNIGFITFIGIYVICIFCLSRGEIFMKEIEETSKYRYDSNWIRKLESERHWRQYWCHLKLIEDIVDRKDNILEIGCGSGFIANYLKSRGFRIRTLDIDENKNPDIVANIVEYNFPDVYDHIFAFEVFEHIPFEELKPLLQRLSKACRKNLLISVPYNEKVLLHLEFYIPKIGEKVIHVSRRRKKILTPNHHWELGYNVSEEDFYRIFCDCDFALIFRKRNWIYNYCVFKKVKGRNLKCETE